MIAFFNARACFPGKNSNYKILLAGSAFQTPAHSVKEPTKRFFSFFLNFYQFT